MMNVLSDKKEIIRNNFSDSVFQYEKRSTLQKQAANRLSEALKPWRFSIPDGPVFEFGAGTGFFTNYLLEMYPERECIISDLSENMVQFCRDKFGLSDSVQYRVMDVEKMDWPEKKYALITSSYVAQWFQHPAKTLSQISASLKPGGLMLISLPVSESFSNWRKYCLDLGLPYTGNSLPDLEQILIELSMGPVQVDYYEDDMMDYFDSVFDFFRHLKETGTSTNLGGKQLSSKQLKLLNDYWLEQEGGKVRVPYHTAFIAVKRDLES